jgi:hypothetical protein
MEPHDDSQRRGPYRNLVLAGLDIECSVAESRDVEPIATLPRHVLAARRNHPRPRLAQAPRPKKQNTNEIVGENENAALPSAVEDESSALRSALGQQSLAQRLHRMSSNPRSERTKPR